MWHVEFTKKAEKQLLKLDKHTQGIVIAYIENILSANNPRDLGKPLLANLSGYWRYRAGKYRLICEIDSEQNVIEVIQIGKRDTIYL